MAVTMHHPEPTLLLEFAGGALDAAQRLLIAVHCSFCPDCAKTVHDFTCLGGAMLEDEPEATLAPDALARTLARLDSASTASAGRAGAAREAGAELPGALGAQKLGPWQWLAPGVRRRTIDLGPDPRTRAFLLKAAPGISLLPHDHSALEWTCVLSGSFVEGGDRFARGDFAAAGADDHHAIKIDDDEDCVCLIALQGQMKWRGPLAPLINLFVRL
jgi:putative transcriptional regulator